MKLLLLGEPLLLLEDFGTAGIKPQLETGCALTFVDWSVGRRLAW